MNKFSRTLVYVVIIVHLMFFLLEAVLWMRPEVYQILLAFLNNPVSFSYPDQALTLRNLFINQGFYNLILVVGGVTGLHQVKTGNYKVGYALILFLCFAGMGAGVVLACSTKAYMLAALQGVPAAIAFKQIVALYKISPEKAIRSSNL